MKFLRQKSKTCLSLRLLIGTALVGQKIIFFCVHGWLQQEFDLREPVIFQFDINFSNYIVKDTS